MEYTLSSGVKINFDKISETKATDIMVHSFKDMKFDGKGNLKDTNKIDEQLSAADKIQRYHTKLIALGVTLIGSIEDYVELDGIGKNWLNKLKHAEIDFSNYDLTDNSDLEFLFLRHYAFKSASDFEALSTHTLGRSN